MVETRRSSSASKRPLASPLPSSGKRSKAAADSTPSSSSTNEVANSEQIKALAPIVESGSDSREPVSLDLDAYSPKGDDVCETDKPAAVVGLVEGEAPPQSLPLAVDVAGEAEKNQTASVVVTDGGKKLATRQSSEVAWGRLISQYTGQNPHLFICGSVFTVGQSRTCNLFLRDPSVSKELCKLKRVEQGGCDATYLEVTGGKGAVEINGKVCPKNSKIQLSAGDELVFSRSRKHAYIFQQPVHNDVTSSQLPSYGILEGLSAPIAAIDIPAISSNAPLLDTQIQDAEMKDNNDADNIDNSEVPSPELELGSQSVDENGSDVCMDMDNGQITGESNILGSPLVDDGGLVSNADLNGSILKVIDEQREIKERLKTFDISEYSGVSGRKAFLETLRRSVLTSDDIGITFENFPYFISDSTKNVLITSTFVHLKCSSFVKYTADLSTVCPRILLSGPAGSEIYQEKLVKALAKHFGAKLLIVDSLLFPGFSGPVQKDADLAKEKMVKESLRQVRASVFAKRGSHAALSHQKKPASSVEADIMGATIVSSQALPKQEASTASSKNYRFKKGDRVKFVGSILSGTSTLQPHMRGPTSGYRGKVVLSFEENEHSKIGVKFDKPVSDGNDLGGLCDEGHGFFCADQKQPQVPDTRPSLDVHQSRLSLNSSVHVFSASASTLLRI